MIDETISDDSHLLKKYFHGLSEVQLKQFSLLPSLYADWNEKINVISRKDIVHLFTNHILHSLSIAKLISFNPGTRIIDVGTGGGFPGIPLAIFFPDCEFLLVDSIGKKILVVNEVVQALGLTNVTAIKSRAEDVDAECDFVVSRAVAGISDLYQWTKHLVQAGGNNTMRNGWLFIKGGDLSEEKKALKKEMMEFEISNFFKENFFETKKIIYFQA